MSSTITKILPKLRTFGNPWLPWTRQNRGPHGLRVKDALRIDLGIMVSVGREAHAKSWVSLRATSRHVKSLGDMNRRCWEDLERPRVIRSSFSSARVVGSRRRGGGVLPSFSNTFANSSDTASCRLKKSPWIVNAPQHTGVGSIGKKMTLRV